jgi:hypothetical protein
MTDQLEAERKLFEAEASRLDYNLCRDRGGYEDELTQGAWKIWQAARLSQRGSAPPAEPSAPVEVLAELERLQAIINTPQADDFIRAVSIEAEHQRQRWGVEHDAKKTPADWFWLVGYLAGKALHAHAADNAEKAEHHVITTAAACANWHLAMFGKIGLRPGIDLAGPS